MVNAGAGAKALVLNQRFDRPLVGRERRIADQIRTLRAEAGERVVVGRLRHGERHARLQRQHAGQRPVVDEGAEHSAGLAPSAGAERQIPDGRGDEDVGNVPVE